MAIKAIISCDLCGASTEAKDTSFRPPEGWCKILTELYRHEMTYAADKITVICPSCVKTFPSVFLASVL